MRQLFCSILLIGFGLLVVGCQSEQGGVTLTDEELYNIAYIYQAPKAKKKQDISEVIKIVFTQNDSSLTDTVAIDVEKEEIYIEPKSTGEGIYERIGTKKIDDVEKTLNILDKYKVQNWKKDYTFEDWDSYEDGYGWSLHLQYKDGTVETHEGSGSLKSEVTPDNFDEVFEELDYFVEERLDEEDYEMTWTEDELKHIELFLNAPETIGDYDLTDVIKVILTNRNQDEDEVQTIGINIEKSQIYKDPRVSSTGILPVDGTIKVDDAAKSLEILEKYDVEEWEENYPYVEQEYNKGYSWNLWLQLDDASVKEYRGAGANRDDITPEEFDELLEELTDFVNERLEREEQDD